MFVFIRLTLSFLTCCLVLLQQIRFLKLLITSGAGKSFLARVRLKMALQIVRPRELFVAHKPGADKRPLPIVPSQMSL